MLLPPTAAAASHIVLDGPKDLVALMTPHLPEEAPTPQRLQAMLAELETVRATLTERKLLERAKGLLMARRQLSEGEAHKMLRQTAMNQNRRLVDVAESLLSMADYLQE